MSTAKSAPRGLKVPGVSRKKPAKSVKAPAGAKAPTPRTAEKRPEKPARRRPARTVIREELVSKLRAAIAAGNYDTSDKLDSAVNRMIAEVFGSC